MKDTETGMISDGKTVLVMRLACSSRLEADRCTVSLKSSHGSIPANKNSGYGIPPGDSWWKQ